MNATRTPSLNCPRSIADVYTTTAEFNGGTFIMSGGNGQLTHPVALLTADEARFAGSGATYHNNSYLRSGSNFWLLTPKYRNVNTNLYGHYLDAEGYFNNNGITYYLGVRPVTSLNPETAYSSGAGTAVDPWVVDAPQNN